jgi:hypothetical protein
MLFAWDRSASRTMTMRETDIPLDIAFVGSDWRITSITNSVPAHAQPLVNGVGQCVIETAPGYFVRNKIAPGAPVSVTGSAPAHLLTSHYVDPHPARQLEIETTLKQNLANPHIARIHLFDETGAVNTDGRIQRVGARSPCRVTYQHFFDYANKHLRGEIVIIANTDIWFDDSLARLSEYDLNDTLLCLSRWDERPGDAPTHFARWDSQDAWVFRSPIRKIACDFPLGVPACDNRIAYEAARVGLRLANPSGAIRARHIHVSRVRNYTPKQKLDGGYRAVPIEGAGAVERTQIIVPAGTMPVAPVGFLYR